MAATTRQPDFYKILGVAHSATGEEITRAYRRAMLDVHPDRQNPNERAFAEEQAKHLNLAYSTLSQPEKRRAYDAGLRAEAMQDQVMSRYTNMTMPGQPGTPTARRPRQYRSAPIRQEQRAADRSATSSILLIFFGAALFMIFALLILALISVGAGHLS